MSQKLKVDEDLEVDLADYMLLSEHDFQDLFSNKVWQYIRDSMKQALMDIRTMLEVSDGPYSIGGRSKTSAEFARGAAFQIREMLDMPEEILEDIRNASKETSNQTNEKED